MNQISRSILFGFYTRVWILFKNKTASFPSRRRWSYVKARYIIGRDTISSPLTTGLFTIECMPKIALWGGLMIGVPMRDPKVPPFEIVKVPPCISSIVIFPSLPFLAR